MKKGIFTLLLILGAWVAQAQVRFETKSTDAVHEMAVREGKMVFIDLYAPWCPPCRAMDKQVFSRSDVAEFLHARFIPVKYNVDRPTGKALMQKYNASGIPTYLIFTNEGELLGRITGASDAETFMADVDRIASRGQTKK